ncbi:MAG TPA: T9SS type A sorting domain-containing protein [Moheibacter sp.]|nr:T9SS type A sorting domain-containing protein [Moheibacter sp.]
MKKFSFLLAGLAFSSLFAQSVVSEANTVPVLSSNLAPNEVILEQTAFGTSGIVSDSQSDGAVTASADDFDLAYDATKLTKLSAYGFSNTADLNVTLSGVSFYIIADEDWYPEGSNPTETNLFAFEMEMGDPGFNFIDNEDSTYVFELDLDALGEEVILPAGKYWLCVVADSFLDGFNTAAGRWNWYQSLTSNGVEGHLTDPFDVFGMGATSWVGLTTLGLGWSNYDLAMIIEGEESTMGVSDLNASTISVYPNPATNFVKASTEVKEMTVLNMNGQVVATSKSSSVNVSTLPAGVYVVKVQDMKGNVTTSKIVKK